MIPAMIPAYPSQLSGPHEGGKARAGKSEGVAAELQHASIGLGMAESEWGHKHGMARVWGKQVPALTHPHSPIKSLP